MDMPDEFFSKFGGLWIDRIDQYSVERQIAAIKDDELRRAVGNFNRDGYVILPGAVSAATIDKYLQEYEIGAARPGALLMNTPGSGITSEPFKRDLSLRHGTKILDTGMVTATGPQLCFAPRVAQFLEALFEQAPLAFQTLHFEVGSTQGIHQDTAYVVVDDEPLKVIASWIALEDIQPGTGELIYYVGGHRLPEYVYSREFKHFNVERDGHDQHDTHYQRLHAEAARRGLKKGSFLAKKGDVLLWHADLPHGGSTVTVPERTRRSLVTHYCPVSLVPHYFKFIDVGKRQKTRVLLRYAICSMYYDPSRFLSISA